MSKSLYIEVIGEPEAARRVMGMLKDEFPRTYVSYTPVEFTVLVPPDFAIVIDDGTNNIVNAVKTLTSIGVPTAVIGNGKEIPGVIVQMTSPIMPEHLIVEIKKAINSR